MIEMRVERMQKALDLTEAQVAQIKSVYTEEMKAMEKMCPTKAGDDQKPDREAMEAAKKQMDELNSNISAKVRACLTEEQASKFDEMEQHMKGPRHPGGPRGKVHERGKGPDQCKCCCHCQEKAEPAPAHRAD